MMNIDPHKLEQVANFLEVLSRPKEELLEVLKSTIAEADRLTSLLKAQATVDGANKYAAEVNARLEKRADELVQQQAALDKKIEQFEASVVRKDQELLKLEQERVALLNEAKKVLQDAKSEEAKSVSRKQALDTEAAMLAARNDLLNERDLVLTKKAEALKKLLGD
jgi:chromosome segregation ATPase